MISDTLKAFLFEIRQHPAFPELTKVVQPPEMPRYKKGDDVQTHGAKAIHASGAWDQHDRWLALLTGKTGETQ